MSEFRLEDTTAQISSVIYDWLETEVETSSRATDVNSVLDDYDSAVQGLQGGFNHPTNYFWNKFGGHMDRLEGWVRDYSEISPDDKEFDKFAVKVTFAGLMEMSGCYRAQCYLASRSVEEYLDRRKKITDINLTEVIEARLAEWLPDSANFTAAKIDPPELGRSRQRIATLGEKAVKTVCTRATFGYDLGEPYSRSTDELRVAQAHWLDFTVDSIAVTAKQKGGDLEVVPFWEPISISEQSGSIYYPFREHIDWAEVMST